MTERLFVHSLLMLYSVHVCVCACKLWEWCIVLLPAKHSGPWSRGRAWWDIKIVAHTRLPSVGFRSWARFLVVSLQVTWVINAAVVCHYFPPGQQLPSQPWDNRWDIDHQITRIIGSWVTEVWKFGATTFLAIFFLIGLAIGDFQSFSRKPHTESSSLMVTTTIICIVELWCRLKWLSFFAPKKSNI